MLDSDAYGEGINGNAYSEEMEFGGEYTSVRKKSKHFIRDVGFYHIDLFHADESYRVVHETTKAILYEVAAGRFWVPKALLFHGLGDRPRVHKSFTRSYLADANL